MSKKKKNTQVVGPVEEDEEALPTSDGFAGSAPDLSSEDESQEDDVDVSPNRTRRIASRRAHGHYRSEKATKTSRRKLETHHPKLLTMWKGLEAMPPLNAGKAEQPKNISRVLKPFQLEGLAWMQAMEDKSEWKGGLLGDEMGLGKTIQAVSCTNHIQTGDEF